MDEEVFIEEIKKYEELYDKGNKFYMDVNRKNKIWKNLSEKFKTDAKKKWTAIRDRYVREKKKNALPSGSAAIHNTSWYLFPFLTFLDNFVKPRRMIENTLDWNSNEVEDESSKSESLQENFDESSVASNSNQQRPSRKRKISDDGEVQKLFVETLQKFSDKLEHSSTDDEDGYFLKSIGCQMKRMSEKEKSAFKINFIRQAYEAVQRSQETLAFN